MFELLVPFLITMKIWVKEPGHTYKPNSLGKSAILTAEVRVSVVLPLIVEFPALKPEITIGTHWLVIMCEIKFGGANVYVAVETGRCYSVIVVVPSRLESPLLEETRHLGSRRKRKYDRK